MTLHLYWDQVGSGEPLLLLHGIGSTHDDFAPLRQRLDADYRVLAPDLPGHGRSAALRSRPTVAAIGDALGGDLDEIGVSLGWHGTVVVRAGPWRDAGRSR